LHPLDKRRLVTAHVEWLVIWIVGAIVASNKGRSVVGWFFLCLLLTPLAILVLLVLPTLRAAEPQPVRLVEASSEATKIDLPPMR
jgi:hypothetical protein